MADPHSSDYKPSVIIPATKEEATANYTTEEPTYASSQEELERNYDLLGICGIALTSGNTWIALGGSIVCID